MEASNIKAMREALLMILGTVEHLQTRFDMPKLASEEISELKQIAESALSAPPRNGDVGTAEEQSARFDAHCRKHMGCFTCPLREKDGCVPKHCEFAWAQLPYEEGGAE